MSGSLKWYAVHTNVRKESLVALLLAHKGYEVLYLHYSKTLKHARRTWRELRPLFPRYVLAGVSDAQTVHGIKRVIGVSTVVSALCARGPEFHRLR